MKYLYALSLLFITTQLQAQKRLTGYCFRLNSTNMYNAMKPVDSVFFFYTADNYQDYIDKEYWAYMNTARYVAFDTMYKYRYITDEYVTVTKDYAYQNSNGMVLDSVMANGISADTVRNSVRYLYKHNTANQITEFKKLVWKFATSSWDIDVTITYTYDAGRLKEIERTDVSSKTRSTYFYNGANLIKTENTFYDPGSSSWKPTSKSEYTYNTKRQNDSVINSNYNSRDSRYDIRDGFEYIYDIAGNIAASIRITYNPTTASYTQANGNFYVYNTGRLVTDTQKVYKTATGKLEANVVNNYHYNGKILCDTMHSLRWVDTSSSFDRSARTQYTYNDSNVLTHELTLVWIPLANTYRDMGGANSKTWHYTHTPVKPEEPQNVNGVNTPSTKLVVHPNPAVNMLTLDIPKGWNNKNCVMAIYNTVGAIMAQYQLPPGNVSHHIPIAHLPAGNYILSLSDGTRKSNAQFVIAQ